MTTEYPKQPLGALLTLKRGHDLPSDRRHPGMVPVVSSSGVTGYHDEAKAAPPGVVTGRYGTIGEVFYMTEPYWPLNTTLYVADFKNTVPRFAAYLLKTLAFAAASDKSTVPGVNRNDLHRIEVASPRPSDQRRIADVLGAFDDKIECNRLTNEALAALATAQWQTIQRDAQCASVPASKLAEYVNGGAYTKGADGFGRPVLRIRELNGGVTAETPRSSITPPDSQIAMPDDLLFSWSGSLDVYRWQGEESIVNQHIFKVIPRSGYPQWLVYQALQEMMPFFQSIARDKATTMGHIQRAHLEEATVGVPDSAAIPALTERIGPLYDLIGRNDREARTLATLRDTLLPKLISGAIRVKQAETMVEAAV